MNAKTVSERVADHRASLRSAGLVKVEVWVCPEDREAVKKYAKKKTRARMKAVGEMLVDRIYATFALSAEEGKRKESDER